MFIYHPSKGVTSCGTTLLPVGSQWRQRSDATVRRRPAEPSSATRLVWRHSDHCQLVLVSTGTQDGSCVRKWSSDGDSFLKVQKGQCKVSLFIFTLKRQDDPYGKPVDHLTSTRDVMVNNGLGLLGLNASATTRVILRRWNDDNKMSVSLVEETGVPRGKYRSLFVPRGRMEWEYFMWRPPPLLIYLAAAS